MRGVFASARFRRGVVVAVLCLPACAGCSTYANRSALIKQALVQQDYATALENVEKIDHSTSALLYFYEKGLVLHYQDEYQKSNEAFEQADHLIDELYTKSVTRELAALAVNDQIAKYRGEPFEAVMVNYYKILNYLHLGDLDGALVECRRVNQKLQMIIDAGDDTFPNDAFLQYLTGMMYDAAGERSDAEVSYRVAADAYDQFGASDSVRAPAALYCDAAANAAAAGDTALANGYLRQADDAGRRAPCDSVPPPANSGTVNLFLECGYIAHKEEEDAVLPVYKDDDQDDHDRFAAKLASRRGHPRRHDVKVDYVLKVALPVFAVDPSPFDHAVVRARPKEASLTGAHGPARTRSTVVENLDAVARRAFDAKQGKVVVRAIVRALAKYAAKKKADKKSEGLGVLVNVFDVVTETADTRSWSTLPGRILMSRLRLPEGHYDLDVRLYDGRDHEVNHFTIPDVSVRAGHAEFMNYRVY